MRLTTSLLLIFLQSTSRAMITALLVAVLAVLINRSFGAQDLWVFVIWSTPFALGVGLVSALMYKLKVFQPLSSIQQYIMAIMLGIVAGGLWTKIVAILLGEWMAAFSLPPLLCWVAGGVSGMTAAARNAPENSLRRVTITILLVSITSLAVGILAKPLLTSLWEGQKPTVIFIEWVPSNDQLSAEPFEFDGFKLGINDEELTTLKDSGLTGKLKFASGAGGRDGVRMVIVASHKMTNTVRLEQPDKLSVIYVQSGNNWKKLPKNAPTISRALELWVNDHGDVRYWIENADGSRSGGTAYTGWK